jgi:hypothetical protein
MGNRIQYDRMIVRANRTSKAHRHACGALCFKQCPMVRPTPWWLDALAGVTVLVMLVATFAR